MKNTVKTIVLIAITSMTVACSAQSSEARNNQTPQKGGPPTFSQLLAEMDANKDGKLAKSEVKGRLANDFAKIDTDNDGLISESEHQAAPRPKRRGKDNNK